jgi:Flp pilus assembly pilin Flp
VLKCSIRFEASLISQSAPAEKLLRSQAITSAPKTSFNAAAGTNDLFSDLLSSQAVLPSDGLPALCQQLAGVELVGDRTQRPDRTSEMAAQQKNQSAGEILIDLADARHGTIPQTEREPEAICRGSNIPPGSSEPLFMSSKEFFMRTQLSQLLRRFARDDRGVTLVEYGIALILAIAVGTTALANLGGEVSTQMGDAEALMAADPTAGP